MAETSFDVSIHLGPGVTSINNQKAAGPAEDDNSNPDNDNNAADAAAASDDTDPNKGEVKCSGKLIAGISMSVLIIIGLTVILVLYLFCQLSYQKDEACYYKEHRMPNHTKSIHAATKKHSVE